MNRLEEIVEAAVTQWGLATYDGTDASIWIARAVRDEAARAVCDACGNRAVAWNRNPTGPNSAGNWTHAYAGRIIRNDVVLCDASSIYATLGAPDAK